VITLENNSSADTPDLSCTVTDATVGVNEAFSVVSGADHIINVNGFVIPANAPDPFVNTASVTCSPAGFPNTLTDSAQHSVNLFQPDIAIIKAGDELSKVGDVVNYNFQLWNNSSADTPALTCVATDSILGIIYNDVLPLGATPINTSRVVLGTDADPLVNTVTMNCTPAGFSNALTATDDHTVNLFQPAIAVEKTGTLTSKVGDEVDYTITLSNTSSADIPALNCTAVDTLLGTVFDDVLPSGDTVLTPTYTVQEGDSDPLVNTVTLTCSPEGFPNVLTASDDHSVELFQPAVAVDKTGDTLSKVGDVVNYTVTLSNTSSGDTPAMNCVADDTLLGEIFNSVLPAGDTILTPSYTVQAGDPDPLVNTVTLTCSPEGFPNILSDSD
ncbi:hypothetical protein EG834_16505, partial [bacterium]|nr:hypothetical protein [bacterium]